MRRFDVEDSVGEPTEVHLSRIDVPFLELTWFFIKASLAMALAFSVTSWLWVMIGTGMVTLSAGLLFLIGVPRLFAAPAPEVAVQAVVAPDPAPPAPVEPPPPVADVEEAPPPEEAPAPVVEEAPAPAPPVLPAGDPNRAATEAAQQEELDRLRRDRNRR